MATQKKSNNNMMLGGLALAAVLGIVVLSKKSSAQAVSSGSSYPQDVDTPNESLVQNSISEDAAVDAQKDADYEAEDNGQNTNSNQNGYSNNKESNYQSDESQMEEDVIQVQSSSTINKGTLKDYIKPTPKYIGKGKPKLGVGIRQQSDQVRTFNERLAIQQQAKLAKLSKMRNASAQTNNTALMQQKLRSANKTPIKTGTTKPPIATSVYPLKIGSRGKEVQQLQQKLGIKADGIFGKMTEASLVAQFAMKQIPNQALFVTIMLTKPKSKVPIKPKPKAIPKTKSKKVQAAKRKVKK